ncbi:MAG: T9SS type A sorting domain-containing protein [Caldithrix sp.]|nr:T9SS type A sorting domain-containing protein [Caldithrix sp.]
MTVRPIYLAFLIIIVASRLTSAQIIETDPDFATVNDSIIIYYDATEGNQGLKDYNGDDVYAHTGVITNESNNSSDWRYVITPWPNENNQSEANTSKNKLSRVSDNMWKLVIGYPRTYYNVPQDEQILQLAFVFRNADGSSEGKDTGNTDIFYALYEPGLTAVRLSPTKEVQYGHPDRSPLFVNHKDSIDIQVTAAAIGTSLDSIRLRLGSQVIYTTTEDTAMYSLQTDDLSSGMHRLYSTVSSQSGISDTDTLSLMIRPQTQNMPRPQNFEAGIHYIDAQTVTLSLFAPHKEHIFVIGDFNDWKVQESYLMNRDSINEQNVYYWLTLSDLTPGTEYAFQYLVDGQLRIADPYTEKVLDPWNDQYISASTYPDLKPYPQGTTDKPVSVLQTAQSAYQWQADNYTPPDVEELVIYEMLVRDFVEAHNYQTLTDTLDYLQNLGITAIELMPVNEFEGNESWGYNPSFYFAPDKYYGPKDELQTFIDACHQRGIAVFVDMVLNHSYGQSPLVRLYNEDDYGAPTAENPWYNTESPNPVFSWGYDFDHESAHTKAFVDRVNKHWLTEYKVDGFRFDFTKGFTNNPGDGYAFDGARIDILKRMADQIWMVNPDAHIILEHFADNSEERILSAYGMLLWGNSNFNYNEATMGYHENGKSDFSWGYYETRNWENPHLVTYMESHDEERLMYKNLNYGNSSGDYDITELSTALERIKLGNAFFLTLPGAKMIWQFGELGYDFSIDYNGRVGNKPIRWDYYENQSRRKLYKTIATLLKLRNENLAFRSAASTVNLNLNSSMKRIRIGHGTMNATIIGNFGVTTNSIDPNFHHDGPWYDYFTGDTLQVTDVHATIQLKAGEFRIYTNKKLETPEMGLLTDIIERSKDIPVTFQLHSNYPNPFNPSTTIEYDLPKTSRVTLRVVNALGQNIVMLVNTKQNAGSYRTVWDGKSNDGSTVASGVYFYILQSDAFTQAKKMILLR